MAAVLPPGFCTDPSGCDGRSPETELFYVLISSVMSCKKTASALCPDMLCSSERDGVCVCVGGRGTDQASRQGRVNDVHGEICWHTPPLCDAFMYVVQLLCSHPRFV